MVGQRRVVVGIAFLLLSVVVAAGRVRGLQDRVAAPAAGTTPGGVSPSIVPPGGTEKGPEPNGIKIVVTSIPAIGYDRIPDYFSTHK